MLKLLVIDDEWLIRQGIVRMIGRLSTEWNVEEATNGKEAIERIMQTSYDLILSDIKMPVLDGIAMLNKLTMQGSRIPVVFLTGFDEFPLIQNALRLRAYDYLLKPVQDNDILEVFSKFKRDFLGIKLRSEQSHTDVRHFEFQLMNALESFDSDRVALIIEEGQGMLGPLMPMAQYVDEIVRIANHFFSKFRIYGFDRELNISSNDLNNMANIRHAIQIRFSYIKNGEQGRKGDNKTIKLAKEYINNHLHQSLTLVEVSDYLHFNPTYFSEYFKEKSGETFIQYVTRMKIEKAKLLLSDPTVKINDISESLGYKDPRSFTKLFKMVIGLTPTEYRNLQQ